MTLCLAVFTAVLPLTFTFLLLLNEHLHEAARRENSLIDTSFDFSPLGTTLAAAAVCSAVLLAVGWPIAAVLRRLSRSTVPDRPRAGILRAGFALVSSCAFLAGFVLAMWLWHRSEVRQSKGRHLGQIAHAVFALSDLRRGHAEHLIPELESDLNNELFFLTVEMGGNCSGEMKTNHFLMRAKQYLTAHPPKDQAPRVARFLSQVESESGTQSDPGPQEVPPPASAVGGAGK